MAIRSWTPQAPPTAELIADGTNPWITDPNGAEVDFTAQPLEPVPSHGDCDCGPIPGVIVAMDSPIGIQRCDLCQRYPGDLEAAYAVATHLGLGHTVYFETD